MAVAATAALALAAVGGWLWFAHDNAAQEMADRLAAGLSSGDVSEVAFTSGHASQTQDKWDTLTAGMDDTAHNVEVADVNVHDSKADVILQHEWVFDQDTWSYQTTAAMHKTAEGWSVNFARTLAEPSLKEDEVLRARRVQAERGDIMGADNKALVTDRKVLRFGIDKTKVSSSKQERSAHKLAQLLEIDDEQYAKNVADAGDKAFVEGLVLRPDDVSDALADGYEDIPGAIRLSDEIPLASSRSFGQPLLGSVGPVTKEILDDTDDRYRPGDVVGLSGLQRRYDISMGGKPGVVVQAVDSSAGQARQLFDVEPRSGAPLQTTIDRSLQNAAEDILADADGPSSIVAVRPSDGHILVAANGADSGGEATATTGHYAPGSTFKTITGLALLRSGTSPSDSMTCRETMIVDGKLFKNYSGYPASGLGDISLERAFANSCNTAFIDHANDVSQKDLAAAAASLGLGIDYDIGFPAYFGSVPSDASKVQHAASMIGQGKVQASPLAMATVAASVASGHTVIPTLLPDHESRREDDADAPAPLTSDEAEALRAMMREVVASGSAQSLSSIRGDPVLAKTGTAEYGTEDPPDTRAWMIAVHGQLAVAVFVADGDSGSGTAGPLLSAFLTRAG